MRTTLSLDDDVAADLRRLQRDLQSSWKQVVNDVLRAGVIALEPGQRTRRRPRRTKSVRLGAPKIGDVANVHETLSLAEVDARR